MSASAWTSDVARKIIASKDRTRTVLQDAGIAVPQGATFQAGQVDDAVAFFESLNGPVVVKPNMGTKGKGVATGLATEADVRRAIAGLDKTTHAGRDLLVEREVEGNDYRFLVIDNRVTSVVMRLNPSVAGDGRSTVLELTHEKNLAKLRNPNMRTRLIKLGLEAAFWLERQGLTLDSVPERDRQVRLSGAANSTLGADTVEVLDETHPSLLEMAVRATRAVPGLDEAGVDLIIDDHRRPADQQGAVILELNQPPGLGLHLFPSFGPSRDVATDLVQRSCELAGFRPEPPADTLRVRIKVAGQLNARWFANQARTAGVVGTMRSLPSDGIEATVSGRPSEVSRLATRAFHRTRRDKVTSVTTTHVDTVEPADRFVNLNHDTGANTSGPR